MRLIVDDTVAAKGSSTSWKSCTKKTIREQQFEESLKQDERGEYASDEAVEKIFSFWEKYFAERICR